MITRDEVAEFIRFSQEHLMENVLIFGEWYAMQAFNIAVELYERMCNE